jgi:hypothetical protein
MGWFGDVKDRLTKKEKQVNGPVCYGVLRAGVYACTPGTSVKSHASSAKSCRWFTQRWNERGFPWNGGGTRVGLRARFYHPFTLDLPIFTLDLSLIPGWCHEMISRFHERRGKHVEAREGHKKHIVFLSLHSPRFPVSVGTRSVDHGHKQHARKAKRLAWCGGCGRISGPNETGKRLCCWVCFRLKCCPTNGNPVRGTF